MNIIKIREEMTDEEFNNLMKLSLEQAENVETVSIDEVFEQLLKG